ncbi:hypothetical protein CERSUDRAFT_96074 [Gelatoporia subvermispora B]|uniref:Hydrophobin n=1 Tax=Ceriporiopsis subvermispora (strain B) TaxID=914234 RepID=M2PI99_CERS8|nr:hypothetical protein CERSUDRAFT_96074 [Gelatoporia subvermispora B]
MFAFKNIAALAVLALPVLAIPQSSPCGTAPVQCCDNVAPGNSDHMREVGKALKMNVDPDTMYGTGCADANPVGTGGGTTCSSSPMCCDGNSFGLIGLGCTPIPVDL